MTIERSLPDIIIERRAKMERVEMDCAHCPATSLLVDTHQTSDGWALVFECDTCDTAWQNTEPRLRKWPVRETASNEASRSDWQNVCLAFSSLLAVALGVAAITDGPAALWLRRVG